MGSSCYCVSRKPCLLRSKILHLRISGTTLCVIWRSFGLCRMIFVASGVFVSSPHSERLWLSFVRNVFCVQFFNLSPPPPPVLSLENFCECSVLVLILRSAFSCCPSWNAFGISKDLRGVEMGDESGLHTFSLLS